MSEVDLLRQKLDRERRARAEAERIIEEKSRELYAAKLEAEFASKTKSEFLSNMSHELRTPLNGILGFCDVLLSGASGDLTKDQTEFLNEIKQAGSRLTSTFNQILAVSRLQDNRESLSIAEIVLQDVVAETLINAEARAADKGLGFIVDIERDMPTLLADPIAFLKMITNLLDNALKFGGSGREILFLAYKTGAGAVQIDIVDQGIGMTEDERKKATLPFYQADGSRSRKHEGSGLGLSIVKGLAEAQDAEFSLFSVQNHVTRASLVFPAGPGKAHSALAQAV